MKAPKDRTSYRLKFYGGPKTPYQPYRRLELDAVPIHQQAFPLYHPPKVDDIVTSKEDLDVDVIPVHQQPFPLGGLLPCYSVDSPRVNIVSNEGQCREVSVPPVEVLESYVLDSEATSAPGCQEHRIWSTNVVMGRYTSTGVHPLDTPPWCHHAEHGDLFVHHYAGKMQIWLRVGGTWLPDIVDGHRHPTLDGYCLYVKKGSEPTWLVDVSPSYLKLLLPDINVIYERAFGLAHGWWAFLFKRFNGIIQRYNTNSKVSELELTFMKTFCRGGNLKALIARDNLPEAFSEIKPLFDKYFGATFSGTVLGDLLAQGASAEGSDPPAINDELLEHLSNETYANLLTCLNNGLSSYQYTSYRSQPQPLTSVVEPHAQFIHMVNIKGTTFANASKHTGNSYILFKFPGEDLE
ncbi:hypothetical protein HYDPIDRAFT_33895 [Hydnomerulius pinastri MD-312]|uniref:Uncharacterized protein n=1 Tax=Hydnomerulius pinastri MD-312 TaxID=994086 RepID=A0A0C9V0I0_9AGAM|nr:hypothetical protein HYDPIDRAFT_33895 [Hydnomerulius pinastri MD-312]